MGYLQDYNAKSGIAEPTGTGKGYLQQYNSQPKPTGTTKRSKKTQADAKTKKISKDFNIKLVEPKKPEGALGKAKRLAGNVIDNLFGKDVSPIPEKKPAKKGELVKIKPGQVKLTKEQLKSLKDEPIKDSSATLTPGATKAARRRTANEMLGSLMSLVYVPLQYESEFRKNLKKTGKREIKATNLIGGTIEDTFTAMLPAAIPKVSTGQFNILKQAGQGLRTGATFASVHAGIKALKEEKVTMPEILASFGIGLVIGLAEPMPMDIAKSELDSARAILRKYKIKDKSTYWKAVKKLHPDAGGNAKEFIEVNEAYNKATSAGIDPTWKMPDIKAWLSKLWSRPKTTPKERAIIKAKAETQFNNGMNKVMKEEPGVALAEVLATGQKAPDEVINTVIRTGLEKTKEGKGIIKTAMEAKKTGENLLIEKTPPSGKVDTLIEEAKKYKSAEEFWKAIAGTDKELNKKEILYISLPRGKQVAMPADKKEAIEFWNKANQPTGKAGGLIDEKTALKSARQGKGKFEPGEVYEQSLGRNGSRQVLIQGIDKDGSIRGWYMPRSDEAKMLGQKSAYLIEGTFKPSDLTLSQTPTEQIKTAINYLFFGGKSKELQPGASQATIKDQKPKTVTVPREQLPTGTGREKVSRLEARIKGVLDKATDEQISELGLSTYKEMNKAETISKAAEYVENNPVEALDVLRGKAAAPKSIPPEAIYIALSKKADQDLTLATKLASLQATAIGQRLSLLTEIDKDAPAQILREVYKFRAKNVEAKYGKKAIERLTKKIKETVKKPDKYDWNAFINSIETC